MHRVMKSAAMPRVSSSPPGNHQAMSGPAGPFMAGALHRAACLLLHVFLLYLFCLMYKYQTPGFAGRARTRDMQAGLQPRQDRCQWAEASRDRESGWVTSTTRVG